MGYDYLGTLNRDRWNKLYAFLLSANDFIESGSDQESSFIKHIKAEIAKSTHELKLLEIANVNFYEFSGDQILKKDIHEVKNIYRLKLGDGDTAEEVSQVKTPLRMMFKRKKDNMEYRIKKAYDLIDQLEIKLSYYSQYEDLVYELREIIETHFSDGLHFHNTSEDDGLYTEDGYIQHGVISSSVDYSAPYMSYQDPPTFYTDNV